MFKIMDFSTSVVQLDVRGPVPSSVTYGEARESLRRQMIGSLRNDRELWWIGGCKKMDDCNYRKESQPLPID